MALLDSIVGLAGTAVFQRTFLLETNTDNGIPRLIIVLDSVQEEEPTYEADVTEHPVEQGTEVTDHIQLKNPTLRLRGTVSNTPLDLATTIGNLAAGGLSLVTDEQFRSNFINAGLQQAAGAIGSSLLQGAAFNPGTLLQGATDALARSIFLSAYERKARFDVITKRQRYETMVIESMSFPRDVSTGYQLIFELNLKHIRVVSPQIVQLGTTADSVANSATSIFGLGNQAGNPINSQTLAQVESAHSSTGFDSTLHDFKFGV